MNAATQLQTSIGKWKEKVPLIRQMLNDGRSYVWIGEFFGVSGTFIGGLVRVKGKRQGTCSKCKEPHEHLHFHHINYLTDEVVPLCPPCHRSEHRNDPRSGPLPGIVRGKVFHISWNDSLRLRAKSVAVMTGMTLNDWILEAIREKLARQNGKQMKRKTNV